MTQPTPYVLAYSFQSYQISNPTRALPADKLEVEFHAIEDTTDQILANLVLIQRDDGGVANTTIGFEQLKDDLREEIEMGLRAPSAWVTSINYDERDTVFESSKLYRARIDHTSGVFATDLAANKWEYLTDVISSGGGGTWGSITGTLSAQTDLQAAFDLKQALDSDLTAIAALTTTAYGRAFLPLADAAAAQTAVGVVIGTNVQAYDADLTTWAGLTPSANAQSLVTAADYAAMKVLLGLTIGTNVQAYDADLTTWAGLTPSANAQSFVTAADYAAMRTLLGLVIGTNVQAYDAELAALSGLVSAADSLPYFTGIGTAALATFTAAGRALVDDVDAAAQRTTLGLGTLATQSGTFSGTSSGTNTGDQTITLTGDVTGSGTGSFPATIAALAVTYAKMQNVSATSRFLGRITAAAGVTEELTAANAWTILSVQPAANFPALTGDVTTAGGALAATIAANAVTNTKLADMAANSIKLNNTGIGADPIDGTVAQLNTMINSTVAPVFANNTAKPTTLAGYGITDAQGLDADLTTIAGLVATTDSFMQSKASAWAARTVAQVKTDLGLTGTNSGDQTITLTGDVTGTGTGSFAATIAALAVTYAKMQNVSATQRVLGRNTAAAGVTEEVSASGVLDWIGATQGQVLYRGAAGWAALAAGTSGQFLKTQGAAADPLWATLAGGGDMLASNNLSDVLAVGTARTNLAVPGLATANTFTAANVMAAGTTTLAPLKLQAGTNLTTAEDGAIEMDADNMYGTVDAGNRGIIPLRHFIRLTSTRTFTSNTSEQAIFNAPANGALTLEIGAYRFKCLLSLSAMSATSGNAAFDFLGAGTAVVSEILYLVVGSDAALAGFGTSSGGVHAVQQTGVSMVAANTNTALQAMIEGVFNVTTGGTVIPSITLATAAAAVAAIGSFFECERIGATTVQSVGQWS